MDQFGCLVDEVLDVGGVEGPDQHELAGEGLVDGTDLGDEDVPGLPDGFEFVELLGVRHLEGNAHEDPLVDDFLTVVHDSDDVPVHHGDGFEGAHQLSGEILDVKLCVQMHSITLYGFRQSFKV